MDTDVQIETIFCNALDHKPGEERVRYLSMVCGENADLRRQVERLLDVHPQAVDFLARPAVDPHQFEPSDFANLFDGANLEDTLDHKDELDTVIAHFEPSTQPESLGRLAHYEVLEVLGSGSCGIVVKAFDEKLHRLVAIKFILPLLATTSVARRRFSREARSAAAVHQENVVAIYAVEEQPLPYLVMEYIAGKTLQQKLEEDGPLPIPEVLRIGRQIASGLAAAHARGLVHRDIKPSNILLGGARQLDQCAERVTITDFGLAQASDDTNISQFGLVVGTPMYMAPEQALGEGIDQRADMFSLGSVLYLMCTGEPPFRATNTMGVLKQVVEDSPRPIREINPAVPEWLCDLIAQLHIKKPADRFASAMEVSSLLTQRLENLRPAAEEHEVRTPAPSGEASRQTSAQTALPPRRTRFGRQGLGAVAAAVFLMVAGGLVFAEVSGVTNLRGTVIRFLSPEGTLVVEVDDPAITVKVDGAELVITGAGPKEIRLKTGPHSIEASRDGKRVRELVTVMKDDRKVVRVTHEPAGGDAANQIQLSVEGKLPATFKNSIGMEFVIVPKGKSWLGGNKDKLGKVVEIPADFYLGKYEVTQEEWQKVIGENPSHFSRERDLSDLVRLVKDDELKRLPVEFVSWEQCQTFVARLNSLEPDTGWVYRLPTELQWEYACRGGPMRDQNESAFDYYFTKATNTLSPKQANFNRGLNRPTKVGTYEANSLGLHDMHGNVWEWCEDSYESTMRVYRGGDWLNTSEYCRAAAYFANPPSHRDTLLGLRVARVRAEKAPAADNGKP